MIIVVCPVSGIRESELSSFVSGIGSRESDSSGFVSGFATREPDYCWCPVSGVGTPIILITRTVAAGIIAAAPEGLSLFGAFLNHALEHGFAAFRAVWCIGRKGLLLAML